VEVYKYVTLSISITNRSSHAITSVSSNVTCQPAQMRYSRLETDTLLLFFAFNDDLDQDINFSMDVHIDFMLTGSSQWPIRQA